jgi:hypothetical protein
VNPDELTAYHEAGHAVAAVALRVGPVFASIVPDPAHGTLGHVKHRPWPSGPPPDADLPDRVRRHAEPRIILALAGVVAEKRRHGRRHNWVGADADTRAAIDYMGDFVSDRQLQPYINWMWARTEDFVDLRWPEIEAVALALLDRRTMRGREIRDVVRSVR